MALLSMDGNNPTTQRKTLYRTKEIALIALLTSILLVQEEALTFIPNVQLTVFLLVLYAKKLGFTRTTIIIILHVTLDNLIMGSFSLVYTPAMFLGWMSIPILVSTFFRKTNSPILLGICGVICSFLYSWMFVLPNYIFLSISPFYYLASDIIFELIMAVCSFVTIFFLYHPVERVFDHYKVKEN